MPLDYQTICDALRAAGFSLFDREPYGAKNCAQANLNGRTHFADDSTLRYFHSRIVSARILHGGAAFMLVESSAKNYENTAREFRFACFDVDGECLGRPKCGEGYRTAEQAKRAFWAWFNGFDLDSHYAEKLARESETKKRQAADLAKQARALSAKIKRAVKSAK
jgi:hypothetical protein